MTETRTIRKKRKNSLSITTTLMNTSSNFSSWSDIPHDLLDDIFALLSRTDRDRFRRVCSPWRGFARLSGTPPLPVPFEPPRLLLPQSDNSIFFFDVFNGKPHSCPFPPSHRRARCLGYLLGWFVLLSDRNASQACLMNPVLASEIPLPDLEFPIRKAVLSAPPGFPNCVVAVMGMSDLIALCKSAGEKWHQIDLGNRILREITFWQNKVCAIDKHGNVLLCDFDMECRKTSIRTVEALKPRIWTVDSEVEGFLVESIDADLLLAIRAYCQFWVFKLNRKCYWEDMIEIRDQALFLGVVRSESVPVNRFPDSGLRKNSIYWTSRRFSNCIDVAVVYSMEARVVLPLLVSERYYLQADPVWISPVI